jgi:hypothetical protein
VTAPLKSERRGDWLVLALLLIVLALVAIVGFGARALDRSTQETADLEEVVDDLNELLNQRTPVIARIDEGERQGNCLGRVSLAFNLAVLGTLAIDPDDRDAIVAELFDVGLAVVRGLGDLEDPCDLPLPPLPELPQETP